MKKAVPYITSAAVGAAALLGVQAVTPEKTEEAITAQGKQVIEEIKQEAQRGYPEEMTEVEARAVVCPKPKETIKEVVKWKERVVPVVQWKTKIVEKPIQVIKEVFPSSVGCHIDWDRKITIAVGNTRVSSRCLVNWRTQQKWTQVTEVPDALQPLESPR